MRKILLICSLSTLCLISPVGAAPGSAPWEMTLVPALILNGVGFAGNFIMTIMTATAFRKPTGAEGQKYDKAAGLEGGSLVANFGAAVSSGVLLWSLDTGIVTIPLGIVLAAGASVMSAFAGVTMDSVVASDSYQAKEAHSFAIANYVFTGTAAAACILIGSSTVLILVKG